MLHVVFLWILSRGIELGVIVLCLLPFRWLLRRFAPRVFSYGIWLVLPVNVVYRLLFASGPYKSVVNVSGLSKEAEVAIDEQVLSIGMILYCVGTIFVIVYMICSYIQLRRCLVGSIRLRENIYYTDRIKAPFSMGVFFPKIFLPYEMKQEYREAVVLHEQVHIKRKDLWVKYLAVAFRGAFWFQPMIWLAYILFINDMESACDETVLQRNEKDVREVYAKALVEVSYNAGTVRGAAIGYGSGEIFDRVRNVMRYRKPKRALCIMTGIFCVIFMIMTLAVSRQIPRLVQMEQEVSQNEKSLSVFESADGIVEVLPIE